MFTIKENFEVDRRILKCDYKSFSLAETSTENTSNSQIYINKPRKASIISLLNSYLDLNFEVHRTDNSGYGNSNDIRMEPIALFSNFKLTTSIRKHLNDISHAHTVSLLHRITISAKGSDDLSVGFDRNENRR